MTTGYCCSIYDEPTGHSPGMPSHVTVYVLGDGIRPLCAAAICLHIPSQYEWRYVSIDPLMSVDDLELGTYSNCFQTVRGYSQDYPLPSPSGSAFLATAAASPLSIVIACHSHAPVAEFWDRITSPKIAIIIWHAAPILETCHASNPSSNSWTTKCIRQRETLKFIQSRQDRFSRQMLTL